MWSNLLGVRIVGKNLQKCHREKILITGMSCDANAADIKSLKIFTSKYENKHMYAEETGINNTDCYWLEGSRGNGINVATDQCRQNLSIFSTYFHFFF